MRAALYLFAAILCSGCATTIAARDMQSMWIGKPADAFFTAHDAPQTTHNLDNGGRVYIWETAAVVGSHERLRCSADIVTDPRGIITSITPREDTIGKWRLSRCAEIF